MEAQNIFEKMVTIITPFAKDSGAMDNACLETNILDDLKVNSARFVDIIIEAEDAFDIEIDDDSADSIETIGDAVTIIRACLN